MISTEATSEVFLTAFRALPKKAREAVVERMLKDKEFMEDLIDVVILEQRRKEPSRSLDECLKESGEQWQGVKKPRKNPSNSMTTREKNGSIIRR